MNDIRQPRAAAAAGRGCSGPLLQPVAAAAALRSTGEAERPKSLIGGGSESLIGGGSLPGSPEHWEACRPAVPGDRGRVARNGRRGGAPAAWRRAGPAAPGGGPRACARSIPPCARVWGCVCVGDACVGGCVCATPTPPCACVWGDACMCGMRVCARPTPPCACVWGCVCVRHPHRPAQPLSISLFALITHVRRAGVSRLWAPPLPHARTGTCACTPLPHTHHTRIRRPAHPAQRTRLEVPAGASGAVGATGR
jgi:hypothetical protein